ncbi:DUF4118 domain-containing protein [Nitrogeniibacter mangrovi]|uniref:histidine kinase n=1 Tax=Nitrogeniibacter mangrovi TaxID=2016596 RepID=A0A6C1B1F0_9RHOO|nr:DUF4118 domain-containing protein [Nitrogeniibacter mangrovi]QID17441.1 DUF4118 domain-containing protein [Nitrogeniibacter mangrovi]
MHRDLFRPYLAATVAVCLVAAIALPLLGHLDLANIAMLFPLAVLFSSIRLGRGPAVLAAILSVALFDFFFVPPRFTLVVSDLQYLLTFAVLLAVALTTAQLASHLRYERDAARSREHAAVALNALAQALSGALTVDSVGDALLRRMPATIGKTRALLVRSDTGAFEVAVSCLSADEAAALCAEATRFAAAAPAGAAMPAPEHGARRLPLWSGAALRGVIVIDGAPGVAQATLDTMGALIAIALERIHYVDVARTTEVDMATERLRNTLLAALSHDIRTPLTALVGLADTLALTEPGLSNEGVVTLEAIREEALRTSSLVNNLLEMARFKSGAVKLKREWQPLEEVVGAALAARQRLLDGRTIEVDIPQDLPLVNIDAVLMERALCNLIENAAKFSPRSGAIAISARRVDTGVAIEVSDQGPGLGAMRQQAAGAGEAPPGGESGLGLAIVRTIVAAHDGTVELGEARGGGANVLIVLPQAADATAQVPAA